MTKNNIVGIPPNNKIDRVKSQDGIKYCFTTSTGYFIARRGNNIFITGNCGMTVFELGKTDIELSQFDSVVHRNIPAGHDSHSSPVVKFDKLSSIRCVEFLPNFTRFENQVGTLGGGNHFIELCLDENETIWATLHSGSRGIGNKIGNFYIKKAQELMDKMFIQLPDRDLAYLIDGTEDFNDYTRDLHWAQEFARHNRDEMMDRFLTEVSYQVFGEDGHQKDFEVERINSHHNFTRKEHHFGADPWITRKGAVCASVGIKAMIPGSMGTSSYVLIGKEKAIQESFGSTCHGAGRTMSRTKAKKMVKGENLKKELANKGIAVEAGSYSGLAEEAPVAYKNVSEVVEVVDRQGLAKKVVKLIPLGVIKG